MKADKPKAKEVFDPFADKSKKEAASDVKTNKAVEPAKDYVALNKTVSKVVDPKAKKIEETKKSTGPDVFSIAKPSEKETEVEKPKLEKKD